MALLMLLRVRAKTEARRMDCRLLIRLSKRHLEHTVWGAEYVGCVASLHRGDYNCVEVQPQARFPIGAGDEE